MSKINVKKQYLGDLTNEMNGIIADIYHINQLFDTTIKKMDMDVPGDKDIRRAMEKMLKKSKKIESGIRDAKAAVLAYDISLDTESDRSKNSIKKISDTWEFRFKNSADYIIKYWKKDNRRKIISDYGIKSKQQEIEDGIRIWVEKNQAKFDTSKLSRVKTEDYNGKIEDGVNLSNAYFVPGMKPDYVQNQGKGTKYCSAYANWAMNKAYKGDAYSHAPLDTWSGGQESNRYANGGKTGYSDGQMLQSIYHNITNGTPVVVWTQRPDALDHKIAIVGIDKSTDIESFKNAINNMTPGSEEYNNTCRSFMDKIYITNSGTGTIDTLGNYFRNRDKGNRQSGFKNSVISHPPGADFYNYNGDNVGDWTGGYLP